MTTPYPVALITGASKRIGKDISKHLHSLGYCLILHYHQSQAEASALADEFNAIRANSAISLQCNLSNPEQVVMLAQQALSYWNRLDLLINNASTFTRDLPLSTSTSIDQWNTILNTNALANLILSTELKQALKSSSGNIINLIDIYGFRPLPNHSIYSTSKAACDMLTKSLALECAPEVRVNGISPGAILWPENDMSEEDKQNLINKIPLNRRGSSQAIVEAVNFLLRCDYITGQVITVDGGRSVTI